MKVVCTVAVITVTLVLWNIVILLIPPIAKKKCLSGSAVYKWKAVAPLEADELLWITSSLYQPSAHAPFSFYSKAL